jgi:hypothetical protein
MSTMEKSWLYFLMLVVASVLSVGIYFIVAYELDGRYSHGVPAINVNVENAADYTIQLSKEVTWNDAMHMIDSLNKTIK